MRKLLGLLVLSFVVSSAAIAADTQPKPVDTEPDRITCDQAKDSFFSQIFTYFAGREPRLQTELDLILSKSGQKGVPLESAKLTSCYMDYPAEPKLPGQEHGRPKSGYRTVTIANTWIQNNEPNEAGIRIIFSSTYSRVSVGFEQFTETAREFYGFLVCHSPVACQALDVRGIKRIPPADAGDAPLPLGARESVKPLDLDRTLITSSPIPTRFTRVSRESKEDR